MRLCVRSSSTRARSKSSVKSLHGVGLLLDRLPEPLQEVQVSLDVLRRRAFGRRAHDDLALLRSDLLENRSKTNALVVVEAARDS
jgi:hypothetical protein